MPLTKDRAFQRSDVIKQNSISYTFHLNVEIGNSYTCLAEIQFSLQSIPKVLPIDLKWNEIRKINCNGKNVEKWADQLDPGFILILEEYMIQGVNHLLIWYSNKYNNDGCGCMSFVDVDEKQYLYTQFEPYYANRVFPLFDQPNLKAKMKLDIISPPSWKTVKSNEQAIIYRHDFETQKYMENVHTNNPQILKQFCKQLKGCMTIFPESKLLPTYLYAFAIGPYEEIKIQEVDNVDLSLKDRIPMSLSCISSLFPIMKKMAPIIFQITTQSMKFFQSFFGYQYAFNKYDQIFVHEDRMGAMENAGCVTFNDNFLYKQQVSTEKVMTFINLISHELSHHWFGNLVTMEWWDDVWLNESFADFMSHFCLQKIKDHVTTIKYESRMASFVSRKFWGFHEDQMVTTHPIRGPVPNTTVADSIFDGITYSKGAGTMKQLLYLMKQENFSKALKSYFHKYEFKNASLSDFIAEMQAEFQIKQFTLEQWRQEWLQSSSLNSLTPVWDPYNLTLEARLFIQMAPYTQAYPSLRNHKIKVSLFKDDGSLDSFSILISAKETNEIAYDGSKEYKAILLNDDDHTYAKIRLDSASRDFFYQNLYKIENVVTRSIIWRCFYEMVRDAQNTFSQFIDFLEKNIFAEKSDNIFERQFDLVFLALNQYVPTSYRQQNADRIFAILLKLIKQTPADQENRHVILRGKLINFAYSEKNKQIVLQWWRGEFDLLKNYPMTVGQQWGTVVSAFSMKTLSLEAKQGLFDEQKAKDSSYTCKLKRLTCDCLKSNREELEEIYKNFKSRQKCHEQIMSVKNALVEGLMHSSHQGWLVQMKKQFFLDIEEAGQVIEDDHLEFFVNKLEPIDDNLQQTIDGYRSVSLAGEKFDKINRSIEKIIDNLERRKKVYQLFFNTLS